jgi:hypothetical protein
VVKRQKNGKRMGACRYFFTGGCRMRKAFFVLMCALISAGLFAETRLLEEFDRNTPEGSYYVTIYSVGKNLGQQTAGELIRKDGQTAGEDDYTVKDDIALSKAKWDLIRQALDRYRHSNGDTWVVTLFNPTGNFYILFVAEYTSTTQYTYLTWLVYGSPGIPLFPFDVVPFPEAYFDYHGWPDGPPPPPPDVELPEW